MSFCGSPVIEIAGKDLSFEEFIHLKEYEAYELRIPDIDLQVRLGSQTIQFIQMFFKQWKVALKAIDSKFICSSAYKEHLPQLHLLRQERLNEDLYDFLLENGYSRTELEGLKQADRIQPPQGTHRNSADHWQECYDRKLIDHVYKKEHLLFNIFKEMGVGNSDSWPAI